MGNDGLRRNRDGSHGAHLSGPTRKKPEAGFGENMDPGLGTSSGVRRPKPSARSWKGEEVSLAILSSPPSSWAHADGRRQHSGSPLASKSPVIEARGSRDSSSPRGMSLRKRVSNGCAEVMGGSWRDVTPGAGAISGARDFHIATVAGLEGR